MTVYEYYKQMEAICRNNENNASDERLRKFYSHSAEGFLIKAENLSAEEADVDCEERGLSL